MAREVGHVVTLRVLHNIREGDGGFWRLLLSTLWLLAPDERLWLGSYKAKEVENALVGSNGSQIRDVAC